MNTSYKNRIISSQLPTDFNNFVQYKNRQYYVIYGSE